MGCGQLLVAFPHTDLSRAQKATSVRLTPNYWKAYSSRPVRPAAFICEMSSALQNTSYTRSPTDDVDELPSVPEKKTILPSIFSRLFNTLKTTASALLPTRGVEGSFSVLGKAKISLASALSWTVSLLRSHPFSSSIVIFLVITGSAAGIFRQSSEGTLYPSATNSSGVSGAAFEVWTDTIHHRSNSLAIVIG